MKLSTSIPNLKRQAKMLARDLQIPLHQAFDRVANAEGFASWSLLSAKHGEISTSAKLYSRLKPGDLLLLGARPQQGKTLMAFRLAVEAVSAEHQSTFFSLEYSEKECLACLKTIGIDWVEGLRLDCSDDVSADYVTRKMSGANAGDLVVIDYLQLLDQKRTHPSLADQVLALQEFAKQSGVIFVFISQIDRSFDPTKPAPDSTDVRLPNPLDLRVFDKVCFMHGGKVFFSGRRGVITKPL